jgi:hypothetical protein
MTLLRASRTPAQIFRDVHRAGGFTQINHPTIFPSSVPGNRLACRGCPWDYDAAETDVASVDAIEIQTGPAAIGTSLNPFTRAAIAFWEHALATGAHVAAVGSSDSHRAGRAEDLGQSPVGKPSTVVYARRLSEREIRRAVLAGHTYVKLFGNAGPDLRLEARAGKRHAIMGDTVKGGAATFSAQVLNSAGSAAPRVLYVVKNGEPVAQFAVPDGSSTFGFAADGPGRYRLQLERGALIEAVSSPIYVEP